MASTEEILRRAEKDIEEEKLWKEQREKMRQMPKEESDTAQEKKNTSLPSIEEGRGEILPTESQDFSDALAREVYRSTRLLNSSAAGLHSHMRDILSTKDVRPTVARTEQAAMCAREIALLMKAQGDILKSMAGMARGKSDE